MTPASANQDAARQPSAAELRAIADEHLASCAADPAGWNRLLAAAAANPQHGFLNAVLIDAQHPGGALAASYQDWRSAGWQVRRGQHAHIWIITDQGPDEVLTQAQVRPAPATAVPKLPGIAGISGGSPERAVEDLTALARRLGYTVNRPEDSASASCTDWDQHVITVPASIPPAPAAGALAHQLAHIISEDRRPRLEDVEPAVGVRPHEPDQATPGCYGVTAVEAASAAWLVLTRLGVDPDTAGITFPAVRAWTGSDPRSPVADAIAAAGERLVAAAQEMLAHAEKIRADMPAAPGPAASPAPAEARSGPEPPRRQYQPPADTAPVTAIDRQAAENRQQLIRVNQAAAAFFRARLPGSWAESYLADVRGFGPDICRRWQLGYAPDEWSALRDHLHKAGFPDKLITAAGLARRSSAGTLIDHFRNRVMIPVRDLHGQVVGFAGRAPDDAPDGTPKYINTPGTSPVYSKNHLLYGLPEAAAALQAGARPTLAEGYFDVIAVSETGRYLIASGADIRQSVAGVAPGGTALGEHQIKALAVTSDLRATTPLLVALDPDAAGQAAAVRDYQLIGLYSPAATTPFLPNGADPAEVWRQGGPQALAAALLGGEHPLADVAVDAVLAQWQDKLQWAEGQVGAIREVARLLVAAPPADPARQIGRVADRTGVPFAEVTDLIFEALEAAERRPKEHAAGDRPALAAVTDLEFPAAPAPAARIPHPRPAPPNGRPPGPRPPHRP